jgi:hypothetical protein
MPSTVKANTSLVVAKQSPGPFLDHAGCPGA